MTPGVATPGVIFYTPTWMYVSGSGRRHPFFKGIMTPRMVVIQTVAPQLSGLSGL